MTSSAKESEVDVALVVIARNEERCIERCLKSAAPHVDDMLVLDTGSTDRTQALAQQCGARVRAAASRGRSPGRLILLIPTRP